MMDKIRHKSFRTLWVILAAFILITAHSVTSHAKVRFNHTVTVENNTELYVVVNVLKCYVIGEYGMKWKGFDVPPVSEKSMQFSLPPGCKVIEVIPSKCGYFESFRTKGFETEVSGTRLSTKIVLTDRTFGKSVILPQCPDRMAKRDGGGKKNNNGLRHNHGR